MLYGDVVWKIDDDDDDARERDIISWCPWLGKKGWPETDCRNQGSIKMSCEQRWWHKYRDRIKTAIAGAAFCLWYRSFCGIRQTGRSRRQGSMEYLTIVKNAWARS